MENLLSIRKLKTYKDGTSIVQARGKIKIGPLGIVYLDGKYEGKEVIIADDLSEHPKLRHNNNEINIRAKAAQFPDAGCIVLFPYVSKYSL